MDSNSWFLWMNARRCIKSCIYRVQQKSMCPTLYTRIELLEDIHFTGFCRIIERGREEITMMTFRNRKAQGRVERQVYRQRGVLLGWWSSALAIEPVASSAEDSFCRRKASYSYECIFRPRVKCRYHVRTTFENSKYIVEEKGFHNHPYNITTEFSLQGLPKLAHFISLIFQLSKFSRLVPISAGSKQSVLGTYIVEINGCHRLL